MCLMFPARLVTLLPCGGRKGQWDVIQVCSAWLESFAIPGPQHRTDWPCQSPLHYGNEVSILEVIMLSAEEACSMQMPYFKSRVENQGLWALSCALQWACWCKARHSEPTRVATEKLLGWASSSPGEHWSLGSSCTAAACKVCTVQTAPASFAGGLPSCSKKLLLLVKKIL